MAININGAALAQTAAVYLNGTAIEYGKRVYLNGTEVFRRCYTAGTATTLSSGALSDPGLTESNVLLATYTVPNCGSFRVNYYYTALWKGIRLDIRVNDVLVHEANSIDGNVSQKTVDSYYDTATIAAGSTIKFYMEPFHPWDGDASGNYSIQVA